MTIHILFAIFYYIFIVYHELLTTNAVQIGKTPLVLGFPRIHFHYLTKTMKILYFNGTKMKWLHRTIQLLHTGKQTTWV